MVQTCIPEGGEIVFLRAMSLASDNFHDLPVRVLIVEDDLVEKTHLSILLNELGYVVLGEADNALDALVAFAKTQPDLVMLDIHLKGEASGVDVAHKLREISDVPVLFLTSFGTREMFEEARQTAPNAYLTKPIDPLTLESHIELALQHHPSTEQSSESQERTDNADFFFTRIGNRLKKIAIEDIHYIEVEGRYSSLVVKGRKFHLKISLKELLQKLPAHRFVRISRNHVVHLTWVGDIDTQQLQLAVDGTWLTISRTYKDALMDRIQLL